MNFKIRRAETVLQRAIIALIAIIAGLILLFSTWLFRG